MDTRSPTPPGTSHDRTWTVLAHLSQLCTFIGVPGLVGPLVVWLVRRTDDPEAAGAAKEALNFQISLWLYGIGLFLVLAFGIFDGSGSLLVAGGLALLLLALGSLILPIVAAIRASRGERYEYPLTIRLVR